ncbi:hypothetical protein [Micromonospora sp. WMMD1082]|uniref:hypothetical protein n=1 Tax=Micromonospora sp. WMMD1082 TaxID=3016104 RepID=UPI002416A679|nr:hypothetical protein [Micromonospora sp. WMMD1082]MDG4792616.1 hypothetical protein [Micromonospora sp. WMMD1082]
MTSDAPDRRVGVLARVRASWRAKGTEGVLLLLVVLAPFWCCSGWLLSGAVEGAMARYRGVAGTATITECRFSQPRWGSGGWGCSGDFVSDDGSLRIHDLDIQSKLGSGSPGSLPARVSGPRATQIYVQERPDSWHVPLFGGLFFAGFGVYVARLVWRD